MRGVMRLNQIMTSNETKREFTARRRKLEKDTSKAMYLRLKAFDWKKYQTTFFQNIDDWFWTLTLNTYLNDEKTTLSLDTKPMRVDPLLWEILAIPENQKAPLSFRANGAFTCSSLPVADLSVDDRDMSAEQISESIENWLLGNLAKCFDKVSSSSFSSQLEKHENQVLRGAYAITLVTSLISEGKFDRARDYSEKYESGELISVLEMTSLGKSFHFYALQWLKNNQSTA